MTKPTTDAASDGRDDDTNQDAKSGDVAGGSAADRDATARETADRDDSDHDDSDRDDSDRDDSDHDDSDRDDSDHDDSDRDRASEDEDEDDRPRRRRRRRRRAPAERPWSHQVPATLAFVGAVVLLDVMVNLRFPLDEPPLWYVIPSTDIAVVLMNIAFMGLLRAPVPAWMRWVVVGWMMLVRLIRFGDGIKGRYFAQRFNLYSDLRLIPDGLAFIHSTRPWWQIVLGGLVGIAFLAGIAVGCYRLLQHIERYLQDRRQVLIAAGLLGVSYLVTSSSTHNARYDDFYSRGFAASSFSRLEENIAFFWNVRGQQTQYAQLIFQTETMLADLPKDLKKLGGANVYLILVESYGRTMFEWPPHVQASSGVFDRFEQNLTKAGYSMATGVLESPTYGGQSWLAHATLDTGIPTHDQLEYEILSAKKPKPIATYFREAGYRTVAVQPNTTRAWTEGNFFDFSVKYYNKELDYHGPQYAWATMPDQYVLDIVRRRELDHAKQPLFIQYVLVSSHAPWSKLPGIVPDWDQLGNGSIFHQVHTEEFPIEWPHFENATEAYGKSIIYDFDVLETYLSKYVLDGSLVIILGDHQPVSEVNGDSWEGGVPVHVLSRNPELVRPFVTRGFQPGIRPNLAGFHQGLETFLPNLLVDFSTEKAH